MVGVDAVKYAFSTCVAFLSFQKGDPIRSKRVTNDDDDVLNRTKQPPFTE